MGLSLVSRSLPARADDFFGADKAAHFGISAALALGVYAVSGFALQHPWQRALAAGGVALGAGVAKEVWDATGHGDPSAGDLAWDAIGTGFGVSFAFAVDIAVSDGAAAVR